MEEITYKRKQVVCREGEPGDCMYYIRWGSVGVYTDYGTPAQKQLAELRTENYFGELCVLDGAPRSATVVALENNTRLNRIAEEDFKEFLTQNPDKVYQILKNLCHKLRNATREYMSVCRAVSENIDDESGNVDEATNYGFGQDERLKAIYDDQQSSKA